jgi:nucleotide-binding universal stress UspA family protein
MTAEGKTETVIVGVDGSPESEQALAWAARYAHAVGASHASCPVTVVRHT